MAIPGYTPTDATDDVKEHVGEMYFASKSQFLVTLAEYLQVPFADAQATWNALEERCEQIGMPNLLLEDGQLDWGMLYPIAGQKPTTWEDLVMYGTPSMAGEDWVLSALGWVDGKLTIFFGEYATLYIYQVSRVAPPELIPPKLYISETNGFRWSDVGSNDPSSASAVQSLSFIATFMTRYGETRESNMVTIGRVVYWSSVKLEIDTDQIPAYAGSVRYYRLFGDTFRLVAEVKIT